MFDDWKADAQFEHDFPFGVPGEFWESKNGCIPVKDMTVSHIKNCMKLVGEDDEWYNYFKEELMNRGEYMK